MMTEAIQIRRPWTRLVLAAALGFCSACPTSPEPGGADTGEAGSSTGTPATTEDSSTGADPGDASTSADATESSSGGGMADGSSTGDASGSDSGSESGTGGGEAVAVQTTLGDFVITLDPEAAPVTVANFLAYVDAGFYDGSDGAAPTIMHRVIPGFVVQGGGLSDTLAPKPTMPPIVNEHGNGLTNVRGSIAMARTMDPDSATSQFFINVVNNDGLDNPPGYAVFGMVTEGMEVVDAMVAVETESTMGYDDVPVQAIVITSMTRQ